MNKSLHFSPRALLALMALILPLFSYAYYDFNVDGIYYYVNEDGTSVAVTEGEVKYSGDVVIPASVSYNSNNYTVTTIGVQAFIGCTNLTTVEIPNTVTRICKQAFDGCNAMTSVNIPNSVTSIDKSAFAWCWSLTSIEIPNSVTAIGESAFYYCNGLESVYIGESVAQVGKSAFSDCTALKRLYAAPIVPPVCGADVFAEVDKTACTLFVREGSLDAYRNADQWKEFFGIEPYDFGAAIAEVLAEPAFDGVYRVYTINGMLRLTTADKAEVEALPSGLYIINGIKIKK